METQKESSWRDGDRSASDEYRDKIKRDVDRWRKDNDGDGRKREKREREKETEVKARVIMLQFTVNVFGCLRSPPVL